ncbi:hypothetical protein HDU96_010018 [Phlyctochytrium bullatum]|nr:hypothetical protein HDU96_010018 [Phlyctochytrium bullatum]
MPRRSGVAATKESKGIPISSNSSEGTGETCLREMLLKKYDRLTVEDLKTKLRFLGINTKDATLKADLREALIRTLDTEYQRYNSRRHANLHYPILAVDIGIVNFGYILLQPPSFAELDRNPIALPRVLDWNVQPLFGKEDESRRNGILHSFELAAAVSDFVDRVLPNPSQKLSAVVVEQQHWAFRTATAMPVLGCIAVEASFFATMRERMKHYAEPETHLLHTIFDAVRPRSVAAHYAIGDYSDHPDYRFSGFGAYLSDKAPRSNESVMARKRLDTLLASLDNGEGSMEAFPDFHICQSAVAPKAAAALSSPESRTKKYARKKKAGIDAVKQILMQGGRIDVPEPLVDRFLAMKKKDDACDALLLGLACPTRGDIRSSREGSTERRSTSMRRGNAFDAQDIGASNNGTGDGGFAALTYGTTALGYRGPGSQEMYTKAVSTRSFGGGSAVFGTETTDGPSGTHQPHLASSDVVSAHSFGPLHPASTIPLTNELTTIDAPASYGLNSAPPPPIVPDSGLAQDAPRPSSSSTTVTRTGNATGEKEEGIPPPRSALPLDSVIEGGTASLLADTIAAVRALPFQAPAHPASKPTTQVTHKAPSKQIPTSSPGTNAIALSSLTHPTPPHHHQISANNALATHHARLDPIEIQKDTEGRLEDIIREKQGQLPLALSRQQHRRVASARTSREEARRARSGGAAGGGGAGAAGGAAGKVAAGGMAVTGGDTSAGGAIGVGARSNGAKGLSISAEEREKERLIALRTMGVFEIGRDSRLDSVTSMTARLLDAEVCILSIVDHSTVHWWSVFDRGGFLPASTIKELRADAFCHYAIRDDKRGGFVVLDARREGRFREKPLVRRGLEFYAGAPLITSTMALTTTPKVPVSRLGLSPFEVQPVRLSRRKKRSY